MSKTPDFTAMDYGLDFPSHSFDEWKAAAEKASGKSLDELISWTMEHIDVKPLYTDADLEGLLVSCLRVRTAL